MPQTAHLVLTSAALMSAVLGCTPPCATTEDGRPSPHRVSVSWAARTAQDGAVRYLLDGEEHTEDAVREGGRWSATMSLLPPLTTVPFVATEGGRRICEGEVETANLPESLPPWSTSGTPSWSLLLGVAMGVRHALFMIDPQGRYRWHHIDEEHGLLDVFASGAGTTLYNTFDPQYLEDMGAVVEISMDGSVLLESAAPGMHHGFTVLPDGGFAYLAMDVRDWTDPETGLTEAVVGDAIWEVLPDGSTREVFSLWDHWTPVPHDRWDSRFYAQGRDWSHGNSIRYNASRNSYLVSFGNLDLVMEIDRETGEPVLSISPDQWSISGMGYAFPHSPSWVGDDRLLLFSFQEGAIGAVEYAIDREQASLSSVWSYTRSDSLLPFLGSTQRLPSGNTLINYGASGLIEEVTADGQVAWRLSSGFGAWVGSSHPVDP